jgi:hypothetical protein
MTRTDMKEFAQMMGMLDEVFGDPSKPISKAKMQFYFNALQNLSMNELNLAVAHLSATKTFHKFPLPAEILEAAAGKSEIAAEEAFMSLIGAISHYDSVEFEDGCIAAVVAALGGWDVICNWKTEDRKWNRKNFVELYKVYATRGPYPPVKITGAIEANNAGRFPEFVPETKRIFKAPPAISKVRLAITK